MPDHDHTPRLQYSVLSVTFPERSGRSVAFMRQMAPAAFWRAWSIWAVSVAATATALSYTAVHPLPAKLANQAGSALDGVAAVVFIAAFATVGALLAWKRPGNPIGWLLSATGLAYRRRSLRHIAGGLSPDADPGQLAGLDLAAGHRAVRVRAAAVSHRAPALPPLAAGGLGRRGRPGRVGAGQRVRPHDDVGQPVGAEPGRRDRAGRGHLQGHGVRRRGADGRHGGGRHSVPGVPVPARPARPSARS